jgi:hypothetical protein
MPGPRVTLTKSGRRRRPVSVEGRAWMASRTRPGRFAVWLRMAIVGWTPLNAVLSDVIFLLKRRRAEGPDFSSTATHVSSQDVSMARVRREWRPLGCGVGVRHGWWMLMLMLRMAKCERVHRVGTARKELRDSRFVILF